MLLGVPFAAFLITLTYFFLVKFLYPNRLGEFEGAQDLIEEAVEELGKISKQEKLVLIVFLSTALCWMLRVPLNNLFAYLEIPVTLSDAGIAMIATIVLFIVPHDRKFETFILEWKDTEKLPWGILLLFGGGLSLASALSTTGLIDLIGGQFKDVQNTGFLVILGLAAVSLFLTEIMSNVALVTIFLPVVGGIAIGTGLDPLALMIPVTLAASCAFMLPMSTPPNAIVFASGHLTVVQMVRAGVILNIMAILWIALLSKWLIPTLFTLSNG